jgi:hypothetical protein
MTVARVFGLKIIAFARLDSYDGRGSGWCVYRNLSNGRGALVAQYAAAIADLSK